MDSIPLNPLGLSVTEQAMRTYTLLLALQLKISIYCPSASSAFTKYAIKLPFVEIDFEPQNLLERT